MKVKVRINLHGIMTVSSASLFENKETSEADTATEQQQQEAQSQQQQQQAENEQQQQQSNENVADGPPEVGSSWTKKISAWFSGVRIRT